jgi:quercetin dioxygenase-like cupin family protein
MKHARLENMTKGWFVGAFEPTILHTEDCEVAVKQYQKGEKEAAHYHRIAAEITVIISGQVRMAGNEWHAGDIIYLEPGEVSDFEALSDTTTVVVKYPSALKDKYVV